MSLFTWDKYLGVELLGHIMRLGFVLQETATHICKPAVTTGAVGNRIAHRCAPKGPCSNWRVAQAAPRTCQHLMMSTFNLNHSSGHAMGSHCYFNLPLPRCLRDVFDTIVKITK